MFKNSILSKNKLFLENKIFWILKADLRVCRILLIRKKFYIYIKLEIIYIINLN